jgi:ABC-type amino acid transport substrate-binding protein
MRATLSRRFPPLCALARMPVLLACALSLAACSGRPDTLQEIQDRGALYIGLDPSYPPFEALAPDGELYGLDVDLGSELAQRLGVESHFVLVGYDGLYDALLVRQVDVLISALVVEPGRMDDVAYSIVYFDAGLALVAPADGQDDIGGMRDLAGRTLAVEYATEGDVAARRWARRLGDLSVLPLTTADEALAAVGAGEADAALVDGISGRLYVREHPELALVPELVTSAPYAAAVRADDRPLLRAVDEALETMAAEGALEAILERYF